MTSGSAPRKPGVLGALGGLLLLAQGVGLWYYHFREPARDEVVVARSDSAPAPAPMTTPPPSSPPSSPPAAVPDTDAVVPPASLSDDEALWVEVWRTSGRGDKETPAFRVGSAEWRVTMTAGEPPPNVHGSVQVRVRDGQRRNVAEDRLVGPGADTAYVRAGPGLFHFSVESFETPWTFVVQEKRVPAEALRTRPRPEPTPESPR